MSDNIPRPPRPPRPGASTSAAPVSGGIRPGSDSANDFGDTRTVILSRKSMSMMQTKKGDTKAPVEQQSAPAPAPAPGGLQKARVENGTVHCVKCAASFPIVSDEFYGAVVECPDCAAEFVIPTKAELNAPAPAPAPARASAPAPKAAPKKSPKKRKPVRNVPSYIESEVKDSEEVIFCESKDMGSGSQAGIVGGLVAMAGGIGGAVMGDTLGIAVAGGVGVLGIILGLVLGKKAGGKVTAAVTDERVLIKPDSGGWVVQTDLE